MSEQKLANANRLIRKAHHEKNEEDARQRFKQIIKKKFTTTFIFCLAEFERSFGHQWGHGKEESELTETELTQRRLWEAVRCSIGLFR